MSAATAVQGGEVLEQLVAGGPVMIPIALCSLVAVAVFFERVWALRREHIAPRRLRDEVVAAVRSGRHAEAEALCATNGSALARVLGAALEVRGHARAAVKERVEEVGRREAAEMERYVPVVGTIASIAPLLGLLGTVGGMIVTFQVIQSGGLGDVGSLAGGISQALITTFAGLCVGIPAVVANRWLLGRVDGLLIELEEASLDVLDAFEDSGA